MHQNLDTLQEYQKRAAHLVAHDMQLVPIFSRIDRETMAAMAATDDEVIAAARRVSEAVGRHVRA